VFCKSNITFVPFLSLAPLSAQELKQSDNGDDDDDVSYGSDGPEIDLFEDQDLCRRRGDGLQVDLHPYIDTSVFSVIDTFSIMRAYTLFRSMGLRHLPVVDKCNRVVGMITRKDMQVNRPLSIHNHLSLAVPFGFLLWLLPPPPPRPTHALSEVPVVRVVVVIPSHHFIHLSTS
jgi:CBS-domain-containing membrane protein